jgi:hypothetical protein
MSPQENPWQEVLKADRNRYQPLVDYFIPAVRLKPLDLWINFRAHHKVAILEPEFRESHINKIKLAIHYIWDAPTLDRLESLRPGWSSLTIEHWHERFERHAKRWGPGDVELVTMIITRKAADADTDSLNPTQFVIDEICYRTGAHVKGVLKQAWEGNWDKLGNIRVRHKFSEAPFEILDGRIVLTIDSYHHSFFEPGRIPERALKWSNVAIPRSTYFPDETWEYFKIVKNNRGAEKWQAA